MTKIEITTQGGRKAAFTGDIQNAIHVLRMLMREDEHDRYVQQVWVQEAPQVRHTVELES